VPKEVVPLPHDAAIDSEVIGLFEAHGANVRFYKKNLSQEGPK